MGSLKGFDSRSPIGMGFSLLDFVFLSGIM